MKQEHGTSKVRITTFEPIHENPAAEGDEYRTPLVDVDEAVMRAEFILKAKRLRDSLNELLDEEYLYSPNLSVSDTRRVGEHFRDAVKSLESGICYVRPDMPQPECTHVGANYTVVEHPSVHNGGKATVVCDRCGTALEGEA